MKIETEKMMEAFASLGWEANDDLDLLELYNADKTRKLEYRSRGTDQGSFVVLGLSFLNAAGGWTEVFSMKHYQYEEIELVSFSVETQDHGTSGVEVDRLISYDSERGREARALSFPDFCPAGRVFDDRKELLPEIESLPVEVDYGATANLFIEQVIRGEMTRPILVPEGVLKEDWRFRPAGEFLRMAEDSHDPVKEKIYRAVANILAERQGK